MTLLTQSADQSETIHVACLVSYDGTDYSGFQYQKNAPTVQGHLENALVKISGINCRIAGSGRTDAGVHARGQVLSARLPWKHSASSLQRAWNVFLPRTISVRKLTVAPEEFHPRFSALQRTYRYYVFWEPEPNKELAVKNAPMSDRFALYITHPLQVGLMNEAAKLLVGTHNFATFGRSPQEMSSVRTVFKAEWHLVESTLPPLAESGKMLVFTIVANGFLRQMVRNLVGSLLEVGRERWSLSDFQSALNAKERARSAPLAPPNGLVLEKVDYPEHLDLFR